MKRLIFGIITVMLLFSSAYAESENLLSNGGFEEVSSSGVPTDWYTVSYYNQDGYTLFEVTDEQAHSGEYSVKIVNANLNDARYVTIVDVEPDSLYHVSGYILVEEMDDTGNGANFALEDVYAVSECIYDTDGEWVYVEWYGETDSDQTSIELGVRIGGYSSESIGTAYFDDISVEQVDSLPDGVYADLWYTYEDTSSTTSDDDSDTSEKSTAWFVLLSVLFIALAVLGAKWLLPEDTLGEPKQQNTIFLFAFGMSAALLLRLVLAGSVEGYSVDISCFSAWSLRMANIGPIGFYTSDYFCDYPPGYMLLLWPVGEMISAIGYSESALVLTLVKSVPILCDMITAMLLFSYAKKHVTLKKAAFVGLLFAFNPAVLVTGSAWGQVDTVLTLMLVITVIHAMEKNWRVAMPVFVIAILIKPQALLYAPIGLTWMVVSLLFDSKDDRSAQYKQLWQGGLFAALAAAVIIVPFSIGQENPLWLIERYQDTLSSYNYAVLNTANLMYLLGGNWSILQTTSERTAEVISGWIPAITGILLMGVGAWQLMLTEKLNVIKERLASLKQSLKNKETCKPEERKLALSLLITVFGIAFQISAAFQSSYLIYGIMWMVFVYVAVVMLIIIERKKEALPFYMALTMIGVYVLGLKIHERYLFAACALLPLAYIRTKDRRLIWLCVGLSITTFINTAIVLDNSILYGSSMGHLNSDTIVLNDILCVVNLLLCGYAAFIAYTGLQQSKAMAVMEWKIPVNHEAHRSRLLKPKDARLHLNWRDYLIMGITVIVYGVMTFTNLGSTKAPQTAWVSTSADEEIVFELEEATTFKLLYYAGVSYNNFSVSVSDDGENWSDRIICQMRQGLCYRWLYATTALEDDIETTSFSSDSESSIVWFTGKYIRINAEFAGLNLKEIILRDENGDQIEITLVSQTGDKEELKSDQTAENLIDEQDTLEGEPGWYNGTYFDEIYYARTAYEHLHGESPYETSHPPLGKLIMSVGVWLFGMTPFGWRFTGALVGVLMLPAMYLFGKQLTKNRWLASFAMLLMTFDLMHFTQTRLATIDSYPVFFIILSYLCMVRYVMADPFVAPATPDSKPRILTKAFFKSLIPLLLSGLFIGCAIASKWTGLYAAVGLAIMFFYAIYRQFRSGLMSHDIETDRLNDAETARVKWARALLLKRIFITCGFCVLFFIAIPAVIYYLAYIPYLSPSGPVTIARIIRVQQSMLAYHSTPGLGMDHPFYSPWWQWPLILKPIWYAQDSYVASGFAQNIVCLGNAVVFYIGAISMVAVFAILIRRTFGKTHDLLVKKDKPVYFLLVISFIIQYLPWALVPRSMFFYHYFPSLPFIILSTMIMVGLVKNEKLRKWIIIGIVTAAAIFFALFYPYASGITVSEAYMDWLQWFPNLPV